MANVKCSILAQKRWWSDKFYCREPGMDENSILCHTYYFIILVLFFKNESCYFWQQMLLEIVSLAE